MDEIEVGYVHKQMLLDHLPGESLVIFALLHHHSRGGDNRSIETRYNKVMEAIHGEQAEAYKIGIKVRGGQEKSVKDGVPFGHVLIEMYLASRKKTYKSIRKLAEKFVDKIHYDGTRESAIVRLSREYSANLSILEDSKTRKLFAHQSRVRDIQDGKYDRELMNEHEVRCALEGVGWDFFFLEDDLENDYEDSESDE